MRSYDISLSWTFDLPFINFSIDIYCLGFISYHIKEILYVNTNSKGNQSWNKNRDIFIFICFWCWCWIVCSIEFYSIELKSLINNFQLLSFMNIFRSSRLQMFFKISALKNFAIFWIKKSLQHRCFPVNIAKFLKTAFLQNFSSGCFCIKSN